MRILGKRCPSLIAIRVEIYVALQPRSHNENFDWLTVLSKLRNRILTWPTEVAYSPLIILVTFIAVADMAVRPIYRNDDLRAGSQGDLERLEKSSIIRNRLDGGQSPR